MKFTDQLRAEHYESWRKLFWLPAPIYYWLRDRYTNNNGWRPLFYKRMFTRRRYAGEARHKK